MIPRLLIALSLAPIAPISAQDGGQLYGLYCSACHGADGKGATGGAFPPLAGSAWVQGESDRAVKIVLHGLHGPVNVSGKTYNLEMPPQGAALPDAQIAAILTHVRSSWGNAESPVTPEHVTSIRAANSARSESWTAEELLKLHPLPLEKTALKNLISRVYFGDWSQMPDFSQITSENVEEEHDGIISLQDSTRQEHYAMLWEGQFDAPKNGEYTFLLDADDAARLIIAGKTLSEIKGLGPMNGSRKKLVKVKLTQGLHPFRLEFLEITGQEGITLGWKGPGIANWKWLASPTDTTPYTRQSMLITPTAGRAAIYRNFIAGTTARAIGFGFPGDINLAYSADHLAPELIWTGPFMDGAHHWTDRGVGNEAPAGENCVKLSNARALPANARFRGYQLDSAGNPTFKTSIQRQILSDAWAPGSHPTTAGPQAALIRTLSLAGNGPPLEILISDQFAAEPLANSDHSLGQTIFIHTQGQPLQARDGKTYITLPAGKSATLTYRWKP
ncbi:MAG: hypothetical protein RLZZ245_3622 [Verrucomicrobiota bacterium]